MVTTFSGKAKSAAILAANAATHIKRGKLDAAEVETTYITRWLAQIAASLDEAGHLDDDTIQAVGDVLVYSRYIGIMGESANTLTACMAVADMLDGLSRRLQAIASKML